MTDPEIRIAIAEACGHYFVQSLDCPDTWGFRRASDTTVYPWRDSKEEAAIMDAPDYPNDLNAMHEAEGNLDDKQWLTYLYWLSILQKATHLNESRCFAHAVAPVRAEAFLRAIGKWKD